MKTLSPMKRKFVTCDEAITLKSQHAKPCADCPFSRGCIKGWLGGSSVNKGELASVDEWLWAAHGESRIDCHTTTNMQCAGAAIYRANVCKDPRDKSLLRLPPDKTLCFASPVEFRNHHEKGKPE